MEAIRRAIFIDGSNLYAAAKNLGFDIDYGKLRYFFESGSWLVRAYYYTAIADDQEYSPVRPLADWLDYNGFTLVSKPAKEFVDHTGRRRIRGNMDVEIAVDALNLAPHIDHMILMSGDGDFRRLIEAMQAKALDGYANVKLYTPFVHIPKSAIVTEGAKHNTPFAETWSCYKGGDKHCGRCGTCVERREAFHLAGVEDPTDYADPDFWQQAIAKKDGA